MVHTFCLKNTNFEFSTLNKYFRGAPGNAKETIAILDKQENYQYHCPYDTGASHWTFDPSGAYSGSFFKQDSKLYFVSYFFCVQSFL